MREKKIIFKILIITIILILSTVGKAFCVTDTTSTKMQIIKDGDSWTNINISDSYIECD